jgi:hypothetical protein
MFAVGIQKFAILNTIIVNNIIDNKPQQNNTPLAQPPAGFPTTYKKGGSNVPN